MVVVLSHEFLISRKDSNAGQTALAPSNASRPSNANASASIGNVDGGGDHDHETVIRVLNASVIAIENDGAAGCRASATYDEGTLTRDCQEMSRW